MNHLAVAGSSIFAMLVVLPTALFFRARYVIKRDDDLEYNGSVEKAAEMAADDEWKLAVLVEENPSLVIPLIRYTWAAVHRRDWEEGLRRADVLKKRFRHQPEGWTMEAAVYNRAKQPEKAEVALREALRRFPGNLTVMIELALIPHSQGKYDVSLVEWRKLNKKYPSNQGIYHFYAEALVMLGDVKQANELLEKALVLLPTSSHVAVTYARIASNARDWPEAETRWTKVVEVHPGRWEGYVYLSEALRQLGKPDRAMVLAQTAASAYPHNLIVKAEFEKVIATQKAGAVAAG